MKYDFDNCILTLDDMTQCNRDIIKSWVDDNIAMILLNDRVIQKRYTTGKLDVALTVVCYDFIVGVYYMADDEFCIQSLGYDKAIAQKREEDTTDNQTEYNGSTPDAPEESVNAPEESVNATEESVNASESVEDNVDDSLFIEEITSRTRLVNGVPTYFYPKSDFNELVEFLRNIHNIENFRNLLMKLFLKYQSICNSSAFKVNEDITDEFELISKLLDLTEFHELPF